MSQFVLFCDGGSRGNPGPSASGYVIYEFENTISINTNDDFLKVKQKALTKVVNGKFLGNQTNNYAEWQAVILGCKNIIEVVTTEQEDAGLFPEEILKQVQDDKLGDKNYNLKPKVTIFLDSELVVRQATGRYKVKNEDLKVCYQELKSLELKFGKVLYNHIYREFNKEADSEVNRILDNSN